MTAIQRGNLGEAAFLQKATTLGFIVATPWGYGHPYDFLVDTGQHLWRVQVKVCSFLINGCYQVSVRRRTEGGLHPYRDSEVDFIVVYIVPEDRWYVVPVREVAGHTSLLFRASNTPHLRDPYAHYLDAWHHLTEPDGLTFG